MSLVIDCHGHFTSEPASFRAFREAQVGFVEGHRSRPATARTVSDDELCEIISTHQLHGQRERGSDLTLISPRASGMGHHLPDLGIAEEWARASNDLIAQICRLFPLNFAGVAQLPQTPGDDLEAAITELERCAGLGFVACNVNPDPSGGRWASPPLTDPVWDPLWSALVRLRMPAMIHVSASVSPAVHTTGAHYLAADTIVFMQLLQGDLFQRYPELRLVIPHGGGAVPYHWGRFRGLAQAGGRAPLSDLMSGNVFFDTCVYHQAGIDTLFAVVEPSNILFGSELLGAVTAVDPETGYPFDDTKRYIDALSLSTEDRAAVFEGNARRVYPRLDQLLVAQGR